MSKDYYKILGVDKSANQDEIKKAFRKLAHEHHPDKKGGNEAKFKEANEAYSVLSDDAKRSQYDRFGSAGPGFAGGSGAGGHGAGAGAGFGDFDFSQFTQGGGFGGGQGFEFDLGDIFGDVFGGGAGGMGGRGGFGQGGSRRAARGRDITVDIELTFSEAVFGVSRTISLQRDSVCDHCQGSGGEPNTELKTCATCGGKGKVQTQRRTILGNFATVQTCETCAGRGKVPKEKCKVCHGQGIRNIKENLTVQIPAGINDSEAVRVTGKGEAVAGAGGAGIGHAGDLYIRIHVKSHPLFTKEGHDLHTNLHIKLSEALLGAERQLETLDGPITLTIPSGVTHQEILRVRGKGVPASKNRRGDLLVTIFIDIPRKVSGQARKIIEELKKEGL